jgi:ornithine cyclodeaminase/alanine dehydrogenase-like protein (mu-crystallin family)
MRLITRGEIARLLTIEDHLWAAETAFRWLDEGKVEQPAPLHLAGFEGAFHAKAALVRLERPYAAIKVNGNFPGNPARSDLPTIQGAVLLLDAANGSPLALIDSIELTLARTAAATALAARHLAIAEARIATICGCGVQASAQLEYLAGILPLEKVYAWDQAPERAQEFAERMTRWLGLPVSAAGELRQAVRQSDVIVTCTTAREPFLGLADVAPGTFIAAVGADNPDKQELEPMLVAGACVYADLIEQCAAMGELHHALRAGAMTLDKVAGELAELVAGRKPGRTSADEIIVFDSTGLAVQDVAAAALAYQRSVETGVGLELALA